MIYEIDHIYDFRVLPGNAGDDFFLLNAEGPAGPVVLRLEKLQFQRQTAYIVPSILSCRVKSIDENGVPLLTHAIAPYVFDLYQDTYRRNDTFEAEVISVPDNPGEEPYMLRDSNGIFFRLNESEGLLLKGQKVRCRFTRLTPTSFRMERVDEGAKLPFISARTLLAETGASGAERAFVLRMIETSPDLDSVRTELAAKNPLWLFNAARRILDHLPEWLVRTSLPRQCAVCRRLITLLRDALLYLLEGSGFLNTVSPEHRRSLRQQLTEMVESVDPFVETLRVITHGGEDAFVESILDRLHRSGYLYHPKQQFAMLMLVFRLYPEKVGLYLNRIFESIFGRDLENWKREPFRSAFVEQFKIYVSHARRDIEALPLAETREQKLSIETIITAIALQLILSEEGDDTSRSEALFYRYVSLLRPLNCDALLSKAFLSLMGAGISVRLKYSQLRDPMMMTQATVMPETDFMARITTTHRYSNGGVDITVSSQGIHLGLTARRDITERAIPEGMMNWLHPQIYLNGIKGLTGSRLRKLSDHNLWWADIEKGLFANGNVQRKEPEPVAVERRRAFQGDEVYIVIDSVSDFFDNNPTFNCHIEDELYSDGTGIIKRDQIVGYNLKQPSERAYRNAEGSQIGFLAKVIDVCADGSYIFSLRDEIDRYIDEIFNLDDEYIAIVAGVNERDYSAISSAGIGLFLEKDPANAYKVGDIVHCRMIQTGHQGQIRAYITSRSDAPLERFDKTDAFISLMHGIGECAVGDDPAENDMLRDIDEVISPEEVRELIAIIRFRAITDTDLIKAYDYLRFARLLALVIGDENLATRLGTHASLLTLHQYFASNSRMDSDKLDDIQPEAQSDPLLRMIFHRLEMVSWLDHPEKNAELYDTAADPTSELEGSIARMVLSYNMVRATESDDDSSIASDIKQQIMKRLNVNNETRRGKYYGSESKYLEFKTSLVYPATAPGKGVREDPEAQQFHILSRIAGMLNAKGGRLYLGVNDDGFEVGMHDDFKYFERHAMQAGVYSGKIKTISNLQNYLENLINQTFDRKVASKLLGVFIDDEAEKGVVYIDIEESPDPVFLDGRLFVRQSGQATYEYHGADIEEFVRERDSQRAQRTVTHKEPEESPKAAPVSMPEHVRAAISEETPGQRQEDIHKISTSAWRPNIQHSYETGYAEPLGYLYFMGDDKILYSTNDLYMEAGTDECRCVLVVPHELADGFLILGYDNERALRVPISEIIAKGENIALEYNTIYHLLFAALASKDDLLICVGADSTDALWRRASKVSQIEMGHLTNIPRRLHDAPIHHTVMYEIAEADSVERFADCIAERLPSKRFGVTMRVKESSPNLDSKIKALIHDCHTTI